MRHRAGTRRNAWRWSVTAALLVAGLLLATGARAQFWFHTRPMPEFANRSEAAWVNTKPLSRADLQGKVVLIEVWTSG